MIIYPSLYRTAEFSVVSDDLLDYLERSEIVVADRKNQVPLFGPYTFRPGATGRNNESVESIEYLTLDFDGPKDAAKPDEHLGLTPEEFELTLETLSSYDCLIASSWSGGKTVNGVEHEAFRAVVRLREPVDPVRWAAFYDRAVASFPFADPQVKAASQAFYFPSSPRGRAERAWKIRFRGAAFDLDAAPAPPVDTQATPIRKEAIELVIKRFRRSASTHRQGLADCLSAVCDGIAFARDGERQNRTFAVVATIAGEFPDASPQVIAATVAQSLGVQGFPPVADIPAMVDRARRLAKQQLENPVVDSGLSLRQRAEIFNIAGVDDPLRHLVIQNHSDYWVATFSEKKGIQYAYSNREGLVSMCKDKLKFAEVPLVVPTAAGSMARLKHDEIVDRYGLAVDRVGKSFSHTGPELRRVGGFRELIVPAIPFVDLAPTFDGAVDAWLRCMGGETLLDWIALAADPTAPLAVLFLIGGSSVGKSFLPKQLARIWTEHGPPKLNNALAGFNDELERCPLLFSDEDIARDSRGRVRTAELRELVQCNHHAVNAKHRRMAFLEGYPRIVISANNDSILAFGGDSLTPDDLEALRIRSCVVRVQRDSAEILAATDTDQWVAESTIPKHALWLAANREPAGNHRFGVAPTEDPAFALNGTVHLAALEFAVRHVFDPGRISHATQVDTDRHCVTLRIRDIETHWNVYVDQPKPRLLQIANALAQYGGSAGLVTIPFQILFSWCDRANFCGADEFSHALSAFKAPSKLRAV